MNGRVKMLIVLSVALIIPSVAIADVMITGSVNVSGTQTSDLFYFTPGTNAPQAGGFIGFSSTASSPYMADIDLENTNNMSVFTINVIQINFKSFTGTGTFTLNMSISTAFPANSVMYYSATSMTLSDFTGKSPSSIVTMAPTPTPGSGIYEFNLGLVHSETSLPMTVSSNSQHIYIGFYVPSSSSISGEMVLTGAFTVA